MNIHIYKADGQPAINWFDTHSGEPIDMSYPPDKLLWCNCCGFQRPASDCVVYNYYDCNMIYCAKDKGCKDPAVIAAKKAEQFRKRGIAQKMRRAREGELK